MVLLQVCEWCISSHVCIVLVLFLCILDTQCVVTSNGSLVILYRLVVQVHFVTGLYLCVVGPGFYSTSQLVCIYVWHPYKRVRLSEEMKVV